MARKKQGQLRLCHQIRHGIDQRLRKKIRQQTSCYRRCPAVAEKHVPNIPDGQITKDVGLAMPDIYKNRSNPTHSYKLYLYTANQTY